MWACTLNKFNTLTTDNMSLLFKSKNKGHDIPANGTLLPAFPYLEAVVPFYAAVIHELLEVC